MRTRLSNHRVRRFITIGLLACVITVLAGGATLAQETGSKVRGNAPDMVAAASVQRNGLICTTNPTATFTLTTKQGYVVLPDGNMAYMWGLSEGNKTFQHPSTVLCVDEGQTVTVVLQNTLNEATSLIFPGQDEVLANGVPVQPEFDVNGVVTSLAQTAPPGGSVTYTFTASRPGTFLYESGTDTIKQVNMGLFGALIVRPALNNPANNEYYAYDDAGTRYNGQAEYLMLLSEIDPMLHTAMEQNQPYDLEDFHVRYWLINGRAFPDTMSDNNASWLPNQPYSALVYIHEFNDTAAPTDPNYNPYPALVRYIQVGTEDGEHHPHGNHQRVIAQDANLLKGAQGEDTSYEKFTVMVGPGQTWDMLFDWRDDNDWDPVSNPIPVTIPQLQNLTVGPYFSGSPYLGFVGELPQDVQALNQCGEYYHISHNHQLEKITAWGMVLAGQITFTRIDPPFPNTCPQ